MGSTMLALDAHLAVRTVHVLAATVAVGVPIGLALVMRRNPPAPVVEGLVGDAERLQWIALAVLVATGVGNLVALGDARPSADSATGRLLLVKLAFVLLLTFVTAVRTFVIAAQRLSAVHHQRLAAWYAGTGAIGVVIVVLAEVVAHG